MRTYDRSDGLPELSVTALCQDSSGFLWIGTSRNGLWRYDGISFKASSAESKIRRVNFLECDVVGNLWVAGDYSVECHTADTTLSYKIAGRVSDMALKESTTVLIAMGLEVLQIEYDETLRVDTLVGINAQQLGRNGSTLWVSDGRKVMVKSGSTNESWRELSQVPKGQLKDLYVDGDTTWFATSDGVYLNDGLSLRRHYAQCRAMCSHPTDLLKYAGNLWVSSTDMGLQPIGCHTSILAALSEIVNVRCSMVDQWGNLWLGVPERGLVVIRNGSLGLIEYPIALKSSSPSALISDQEGIWAVGRNGWLSLMKGSSVTESLYRPYGDNIVTAWTGSWEERHLVGTNRGLFRSLGTSDILVDIAGEVTSSRVQDLESITDSTWLALVASKLYLIEELDGGTLSTRRIEQEVITCLEAHEEGVWVLGPQRFGHFSEGVVKWHKQDDLKESRWTALAVGPAGQVALGTSSGEVLVMQEDHSLQKLAHVQGEEIKSIFYDRKSIYLTTSNDLKVYDLETSRLSTAWRHQGEFLAVAPARNILGGLYFATSEGVFYMHHSYQEEKLQRGREKTTIKLLDRNDRNHTFKFESSNLSQVHSRDFRWRIPGSQFSRWQYTGGDQVQVAGLTPGENTLEVEVRYNEGSWSEIGRRELNVMGPWWTRPWIGVLIPTFLVSILVAVAAVVVRRREKQLKEKQRLLERRNKVLRLEQEALRGQMNPHFIFNALQSIQSKVLLEDAAEARRVMLSFSKLLRGYLNQSREVTRPLGKEVELVRSYLTWEKEIRKDAFNFDLDIPQFLELEDVLIPSMLIQPMVENCIKHGLPKSGAVGHICMKIDLHGRYIRCIIEDNGPGYEGRVREDSSGLAVTANRLRMYADGRQDVFKIESRSAIDKSLVGTRVTLLIPFDKHG